MKRNGPNEPRKKRGPGVCPDRKPLPDAPANGQETPAASKESELSAAGADIVAVFGGSFDPPHLAHTMAAAYVLAAYRVDRLLVVPTYRHAFDKPLADFDHRCQMCTLAMADLKRVDISPIERDIGGKSLTLRTLEELRRRMPNVRLRLLVGSDLLQESARWHHFDRVIELAPPIWLNRPPHPFPHTPQLPDDSPPSPGPLFPDISSTDIRRRIAQGHCTRGLVAHAVATYIQRHGLYRM